MSLTKNFRRTGAAARNEKREIREYLYLASMANSRVTFRAALAALRGVDPEGWEAWYDDNANVPEELDFSDARQIERVIVKIRAQIAVVMSKE